MGVDIHNSIPSALIVYFISFKLFIYFNQSCVINILNMTDLLLFSFYFSVDVQNLIN